MWKMGWSPCTNSHLKRPVASGGREKELGGNAGSEERKRWSLRWSMSSKDPVRSFSRAENGWRRLGQSCQRRPNVNGGWQLLASTIERKERLASCATVSRSSDKKLRSSRSPDGDRLNGEVAAELFMSCGEK
jgi:hypothetical protein